MADEKDLEGQENEEEQKKKKIKYRDKFDKWLEETMKPKEFGGPADFLKLMVYFPLKIVEGYRYGHRMAKDNIHKAAEAEKKQAEEKAHAQDKSKSTTEQVKALGESLKGLQAEIVKMKQGSLGNGMQQGFGGGMAGQQQGLAGGMAGQQGIGNAMNSDMQQIMAAMNAMSQEIQGLRREVQVLRGNGPQQAFQTVQGMGQGQQGFQAIQGARQDSQSIQQSQPQHSLPRTRDAQTQSQNEGNDIQRNVGTRPQKIGRNSVRGIEWFNNSQLEKMRKAAEKAGKAPGAAGESARRFQKAISNLQKSQRENKRAHNSFSREYVNLYKSANEFLRDSKKASKNPDVKAARKEAANVNGRLRTNNRIGKLNKLSNYQNSLERKRQKAAGNEAVKDRKQLIKEAKIKRLENRKRMSKGKGMGMMGGQ